jgi:hypothetical protein
VAAATSAIAAILFSAVPWNFGLILAGVSAMIAGAQTEFWMRRRARAGGRP